MNIDDLLKQFDSVETAISGMKQDPGFVADVEEFMGKVLVRFDSQLRAYAAIGATMAGAAAGPAGPIVGLVTGLVENAALTYVEKWLASKSLPTKA